MTSPARKNAGEPSRTAPLLQQALANTGRVTGNGHTVAQTTRDNLKSAQDRSRQRRPARRRRFAKA